MPPRKKGRGRGRGADTLASQPVDLNDDEISDTSQTSNIETKKEVLDRERKYPWKDGHQETLAEFWLNHPIFYDKTQEHYKNSQMKCQLIRDLIEQHHNEWEELYKPLPTGEFKSLYCRIIYMYVNKSVKYHAFLWFNLNWIGFCFNEFNYPAVHVFLMFFLRAPLGIKRNRWSAKPINYRQARVKPTINI